MAQKRQPKKPKKADISKAGAGKSSSTGLPVTPHQLVELYLLSASVSRRQGPIQLPKEFAIELRFNVSRSTSHDKRLVCHVIFSIAGRTDDNVPTPVSIRADFNLTYEYPHAIEKDPTQDEIALIGKEVMHHAWPYWREFVQSAAGRMGIPPMRMPLVLAANMQFDAQEVPVTEPPPPATDD